jgi:hypothetical protein
MKYMKGHKSVISLRKIYFALGLCAILVAALANSSAPSQAALKSPVTNYIHQLERCDCSLIRGYIWDNDAQNVTISVDIYVDAVYIATIPANQFRRDLERAGFENPYHGFSYATPNSAKDGNIHTINVKIAGTNTDLSGSPRYVACDSSVFPTAVPATTAGAAGQTWEQGVEVSSSLNGIITEVKFWRPAGEPKGGHTARIWSTSGTLLKSASFVESNSPGWQYASVNFPVTAGVRYRITYNVNQEVAKTLNVFNSGPITIGPLTAWGSWYGTPAATFPTSSSTSNLFADVVFSSQ